IKITAKTGEGDKLFGSVTNADLADALEKQGVSIDKKYVSIAGGTVKRTGQYEATIRFHREVLDTLTFEVVAEPKPETKAKPKAEAKPKEETKPEGEAKPEAQPETE